MIKRFTNDFRFCYPILEYNVKSFLKKTLSIAKRDDSLIELRLDYLLEGGTDFEKILELISKINYKISCSRLIATIRTKDDGGEILISDNLYLNYISELFKKANVNYIDLEYEYYKRNKSFFDELLKNKKQKVILSKHIFNEALEIDEYKKAFCDMNVPYVDIVKFAILLDDEKELFDYMMTARESSKLIQNAGKECIFIAMGKIGSISRLWPEFTNTKIVFLTAYDEKVNKIGQLSYEDFVKYRKLLEKNDKNW